MVEHMMENGGTAMNILENMMGNLGKLERLNHETCGNAPSSKHPKYMEEVMVPR